MIYGGDFEYEDATQYFQNIDAMIETINSLVSFERNFLRRFRLFHNRIVHRERRNSMCIIPLPLVLSRLYQKKNVHGHHEKEILCLTHIVHMPFGQDFIHQDRELNSMNDH